MGMEVLQVRLPKKVISDIDKEVKKGDYANRSDLLREGARRILTDAEKQEIFKRLDAFKGSLKGKRISNISEEEAGERAFRRIAKRFGIELD